MFASTFKSGFAVASSVIGFSIISLAPVANAQTVLGPLANTNGTVSHTTEFVGTGTDKLTFSTFDSNLGTLTSIGITVNGALDSVVHVSNNALTASNGHVKTESVYQVKDAGNLVTLNGDILTNNFFYNLNPGESVDSSPNLTGSDNVAGSYTLQSILDAFTTNGAGSIDMGITTTTSTLLANTGGNTASSQATTGIFSGTITYTYTDSQGVPEAGTTAVLGLGSIAGVGSLVVRRRRLRSGK